MDIYFHFLQKVTLNRRKYLKDFIEEIFVKEKVKADSLNVIFCDDEYLLNINKRFLKHDYYTDIISFNLNEEQYPLNGEIYISVARVKDNSKQHRNTLNEELHRVIFHGILHFCGYRDKSKQEIKCMRDREDYYLKKYYVSRET